MRRHAVMWYNEKRKWMVYEVSEKGTPEEETRMKLRDDYMCPVELMCDLIRGKWKPTILWWLRKGPVAPSQLLRDISGITPKMLQQNLRELVECSFADKKVYGGYPLRTEYFLTPRGEEVLEALAVLQRVGIDYMLENGQEDFLRQRGLIGS